MYEIVSYGGGTQSTALIIMALEGKFNLKRPDFAIYADTGGEPEFINRYVDYFIGYVKEKYNFFIYKIQHKKGIVNHLLHSEIKYRNGNAYINSFPPFFTLNGSGEIGMLMRQCTSDFKTKPISSFITKKIGRNVPYRLWIAISFDERSRMKVSTINKRVNYYPLVENFINRADSINYLKGMGVKPPQRSSCFFCPFHSDKYWVWLKKYHSEEFNRAIKFEQDIQDKMKTNKFLKYSVFLHRSCKSLAIVKFDNENQLNLFPELIDECDGLCGI